MSDYKQLVHKRIFDRNSFIRAVLSGKQKGKSLEWVKVTIRPVEIKGGFHWQFSYFDDIKDITKNYVLAEAEHQVNEVLTLPFRNIFVESNAGNIQVNISKKGKVLVKESKPTSTPVSLNLLHDRSKPRLLSIENARPFLQATGILTKDGKIKSSMQRKYKQINEFLRLLSETASFETWSESPIRIIDFGCGNAYLTFAVYYYLHDILNLDAHVTGVDVNADLIERHQKKVASLKWEHLSFQVNRIVDYQPETPPDVVIALHACDTATDDALAKGIHWGSKVILCAPCCQHELQVQLSKTRAPAAMLPVFQDGILFERMGDILTDTFRATILRILGYRTDVTQFIPIEHTAKNLMIRSVKTIEKGNERWLDEYQNLKAFWKVTPYLERLLGEKFAHLFTKID